MKLVRLVYLNANQLLIHRAEDTLQKEALIAVCPAMNIAVIRTFIDHGKRQIDQIERRLLNNEKTLHGEKVFSLFQPHTEWISKGKAGVPVELGVRLAIVEDQHGFILNHRVMEKETDEKVESAETGYRLVDLDAYEFDILAGTSLVENGKFKPSLS